MHRARRGDTAITATAAAVLAGTAALAASGEVPEPERTSFDAVNGLPDVPYAVVWPFLQLGSLGGALAVAVAVGAARSRRAGLAVAAAGVAAWAVVKLAKAAVGRGRPSAVLAEVVTRGEAATGHGFPSAHAAVAGAVAAAAWPALGTAGRAVLVVAAAAVAVLRVYVGAHLPLDVVGGAALGALVAGLARLAAGAVR